MMLSAVHQALDGFAQRGVPVVLCTADVPAAKKLCFVGQDHYFGKSAPGPGQSL